MAVRPQAQKTLMTTIIEKHGRRNWALRDTAGNLLALTVYKCGARNLQEILAGKTLKVNDEIATHQIAEVEE